MIYRQNYIYLLILETMYKIKDYLIKYNKSYDNISSKKNIDDLIDLLYEKIKSEFNIKLNKQEFIDVFTKYSYLHNTNLILDTFNKSNNNYDSLINLFVEKKYLPIRHNGLNNMFGPFSRDWIHDIQVDDDVSKPEIIRRRLQFEKLNSIKYPAQRSPEWYAQRDGKITASDAGVVIGENKYEFPYKMIVKKIRETFQNNEATYHGKKYEDIAKLIYEYRMNVSVHEFGMVEHPVIGCLGASPDGIITPYKNDGIHLTELVGRMIEIKVPLSRQIQKTGEIKGEICPIYYWDQVQLQLECCDLDECDFWQCTLREYPSWETFLNDTCKSEPFRSKTTSFEKGVLIQILPSDKIVEKKDPQYLSVVHEYAKFIHPPKIEMTPEDCKIWLDDEISKLNTTNPNYSLDRVVYWYLAVSHCELIKRDNKWFESVKHKYTEMWDYITFVRSDIKYKNFILDIVDNVTLNDKFKDKYIEENKNKVIFELLNILQKDNTKYDKLYKLYKSYKFNTLKNKDDINNALEKMLTKLLLS